MNKEQIAAFYGLTRSIRQLFHKLGHGVGALHAHSDVSAGMRAILETLTERGPMTVPEIARIRPVSRQHVQSLVDPLLEQGYVEAIDNPVHKRSKLIEATAKGERKFKAMREIENAAFKRMKLGISSEEFRNANEVLELLIDALDSAEWRAIVEHGVDRDNGER